MPSEKSARVAEKKRLRNRVVRGTTRSHIAQAIAAIQEGEDLQGAEAAVLNAIKALDKAATKGVLHPNNVARRKSRLMAKLNTLRGRITPTASPSAEAEAS